MLRDVMEDTFLTGEDLRPVFGDEIVDILKLLTRSKDEDYFAYIERISKNETAKQVKLADLKHNSDIEKLPEMISGSLLIAVVIWLGNQLFVFKV